MRIIGEIPSSQFKITVFYMNQKYIVKFEKGPLEQIYKFSELDFVIRELDDVVKMITPEMQENVDTIFLKMKDLINYDN